MKKLKLFVVAILFTGSLFAVLPARAAGSNDPNVPCSGGDPDNPCGVSSSDSSSLPIDGQVWFLIAAGAVVGTTVIISKSKAAKPTATPIQ